MTSVSTIIEHGCGYGRPLQVLFFEPEGILDAEDTDSEKTVEDLE